jgi:hypothetical protein
MTWTPEDAKFVREQQRIAEDKAKASFCKHRRELSMHPDKPQMAEPASCRCGFNGCCAIGVYEHILWCGSTREHEFVTGGDDAA